MPEILLTKSFRVTMRDTDAAGLIYYGVPLEWAERVSAEWFAEIGYPISRMIAGDGGFPAVHAEVDYKGPLRLDDVVFATLGSGGVTERSMTLVTEFAREGDARPSVVTKVTQVHINTRSGDAEAAPLPRELVERLGEG